MITITNDQIATIENNREWCENIHFNDFLLALIRVGPKYLLWPYGAKEQMIERVFAYELYHQWRIVADHYEYDNLIINGEIRKDRSIYRQNLGIVYPDLILHEQQNNTDQQVLACEIKTVQALNREPKSLIEDLLKLDKYIDVLDYEISVFIQIKNPFDEFLKNRELLRQYEGTFNNPSKIFYVVKENDYISYQTLENLLA